MSSFKFVFIPCDATKPIEEREGQDGGLTNDFLIQHAKKYFAEESSTSGGDASSNDAHIDAQQVRQQIIAAGGDSEQLRNMDDSSLIDLITKTQSQTSCEITALTIPTPDNKFEAVSLYGDDHARNKKLPLNDRASALGKGCGHSALEIHGDVFVGRCVDNEVGDVWKRVNFRVDETDQESEWCLIARRSGGGGSNGGGTPASLSGSLQQVMGGANRQRRDNIAQEEDYQGFKWSQNDEEVELRLPNLPPGTKAKYIKVSFTQSTLKVTVTGNTMLSGKTGGEVDVSCSTWTIQDGNGNMRELCITLCKRKVGSWIFAVQ